MPAVQCRSGTQVARISAQSTLAIGMHLRTSRLRGETQWWWQRYRMFDKLGAKAPHKATVGKGCGGGGITPATPRRTHLQTGAQGGPHQRYKGSDDVTIRNDHHHGPRLYARLQRPGRSNGGAEEQEEGEQRSGGAPSHRRGPAFGPKAGRGAIWREQHRRARQRTAEDAAPPLSHAAADGGSRAAKTSLTRLAPSPQGRGEGQPVELAGNLRPILYDPAVVPRQRHEECRLRRQGQSALQGAAHLDVLAGERNRTRGILLRVDSNAPRTPSSPTAFRLRSVPAAPLTRPLRVVVAPRGGRGAEHALRRLTDRAESFCRQIPGAGLY
eukprot:gene17364-biopygen2123